MVVTDGVAEEVAEDRPVVEAEDRGADGVDAIGVMLMPVTVLEADATDAVSVGVPPGDVFDVPADAHPVSPTSIADAATDHAVTCHTRARFISAPWCVVPLGALSLSEVKVGAGEVRGIRCLPSG